MATNPILDQRVMRALQETLDDVMLKDTQEFLYSVSMTNVYETLRELLSTAEKTSAFVSKVARVEDWAGPITEALTKHVGTLLAQELRKQLQSFDKEVCILVLKHPSFVVPPSSGMKGVRRVQRPANQSARRPP